jgi:hypothetical protein
MPLIWMHRADDPRNYAGDVVGATAPHLRRCRRPRIYSSAQSERREVGNFTTTTTSPRPACVYAPTNLTRPTLHGEVRERNHQR